MRAGNVALAANAIRRCFGGSAVLDNVCLSLYPGEITLLTGRNGSGKTTLLNCLSGFDLSFSGQVVVRGREVGRLRPSARARLGIVRTFQYPHLFSDLTVEEHLRLAALAALPAIRACCARWTARDHVGVDEFELGPLLSRRARSLSFGEMKVVNTARAMAANPSVLLLDEPLASLHGRRRYLVVEAIRRRARSRTAVLVVEHETEELRSFVDRHYELYDGRLTAGSTL